MVNKSQSNREISNAPMLDTYFGDYGYDGKFGWNLDNMNLVNNPYFQTSIEPTNK